MANNTNVIKICFIAPKAYPLFNPSVKAVFGGAEVDLYFLATELAKDKNFRLSVITADYSQQDIENIEAVQIIKSLDFNKNPLAGALRVWQAMRQANADIYMIKTISPGMFLTALFCKLKQKTFLFRTSNTNSCDGTYISQHPLFGALYKLALKTAKIVSVQNETDKINLKQTTGKDSTVIPNGHRLTQQPGKERDTILWVGRSAPIKKPQLFVDLARQFPNQQFTMICQQATGDRRYGKLLANAKETPNLQFIEQVAFNEIDSYFKRAKVLVNTSLAEGFPNTFIQACCSATPILSLAVDPDGFLSQYNCGLNCNGQSDKFVDSLRFMLTENKYVELGQNAAKYVKDKHDIAKITEEYKKLFYSLF